MSGGLPIFISSLRSALDFDRAATVVLQRLLAIAAECLTSSPYAPSGRILRGTVHSRPDNGYRSLAVLESGSPDAVEPDDRPSFLPSAAAWRWIEANREAVAIDVLLRTISRIGEQAAGAEALARPFDGEAGIESDATHILVLPLISPSQRVVGMISIEAACAAASGGAFIWPDCVAELQLRADVAAPFLNALPLRAAGEAPDPLLPVIGSAMAPIVRVLRSFAAQEETLLFLGPTGVGKSRLARWSHAHSPRRSGPFEVVDLVAFPEEMQMAELFGWRKGAFTGAVRDHSGAVARAEGGTLFIDEIGNLSAKAQAGLLHLLEERRYRRLGESGPERQANVRFIVATHTDLKAAVAAKRFREDLYYRINVLPVRLPPLRERVDEIERWVGTMLDRSVRSTGELRGAELTDEAIAVLTAEAWPGNLRQLDNVVRRALAIARADGSAGLEVAEIDEPHVRSAIAFESNTEKVGVVEALAVAASEFVAESERLRRSGGELGLDESEVFPGMVLLAAIQRYGSADRAFRELGKHELVAGRNHHKALRRALTRVAELCKRLGREPADDVRRILGG